MALRAVLGASTMMRGTPQLIPVTDEMLAEVRRLSYEGIAQGGALAVLPVTMLSLVDAIETARAIEGETWGHCPSRQNGLPHEATLSLCVHCMEYDPT